MACGIFPGADLEAIKAHVLKSYDSGNARLIHGVLYQKSPVLQRSWVNTNLVFLDQMKRQTDVRFQAFGNGSCVFREGFGEL